MTIDEAIAHTEEVAEEHERHLKVYENMDEDRPLFREEENECKDCAEEHRQLAGWLKELKQLRKQEPCEDARSLAQVFEILGNLMSIPYDLDRPINKDDVSESMDAIRALPTVTPTRKKGKWINKSHTSGCGITFVASECTCCGKKTFFDCDQLVYNYCPNCGAEMESEE